MTRMWGLILLLVLGCAFLAGCGKAATPPPPTADQERQIQQQLDQAAHAEGRAQQEEKKDK